MTTEILNSNFNFTLFYH